jgi:hypothetical protein
MNLSSAHIISGYNKQGNIVQQDNDWSTDWNNLDKEDLSGSINVTVPLNPNQTFEEALMHDPWKWAHNIVHVI